MNKIEAYNIAQNQLLSIKDKGFNGIKSYIGNVDKREILGKEGATYDVEISYKWKNKKKEVIIITCSVTSNNWFQHEQLNESISLYKPKI
jgi:hypothetical protein